MNHEARVIMLNECEQLWSSRAAQALDARLTNHVVAPSVNPALEMSTARAIVLLGGLRRLKPETTQQKLGAGLI